VYVELLDDDGTPIQKSTNLTSNLPLPTKKASTSTSDALETHRTSNGERVRILYRSEGIPGDPGDRLLVARSLHQTDAALDTTRNLLIGGGIAVLVMANVLAYIFSGPALRPIRVATDTASDIEATGDFTRRISGERQRGEVGDLVRTLNELIAKVESTLDAHRAFLADSSHELRRPLAVVRGNLEVLRSGALPVDEREQVIAETEAESRRMSRMLADLLLLSQVDARLILQRRSADLGELLRQVGEHEQQRFRERKIAMDVPETPMRVNVDEQRVSQLFENLVDNAARYSEPGRPIELACRANGRYVITEVRDHGPGMTPDEMRHAFERFYRGQVGRRRHRDGSGLGLAIVRHIAEAHGGSVALSSSSDGTVVRVELPLANL
jgi:two-component system OmpR family sensor kinase